MSRGNCHPDSAAGARRVGCVCHFRYEKAMHKHEWRCRVAEHPLEAQSMNTMDWVKAWIGDCTKIETEAALVGYGIDPPMRHLLGRIWRMGFRSGAAMAMEEQEEQQIEVLV